MTLPFDWADIRLVAFDVDGTLYRQRPLRLRMARDLLWHSVRQRDRKALTVLSAYRRLREGAAEHGTRDFEPALIAATAAHGGCSPDDVRRIAAEWIDERPLAYLRRCRYRGVGELMAGIRASGRIVGVLSDYPVAAKLHAMGLRADHAVSAIDADVRVLKPDATGLRVLMANAGVEPRQTVLIGDRAERDGLAARAAGANALLRAASPIPGWPCFRRYDDAVFGALLGK